MDVKPVKFSIKAADTPKDNSLEPWISHSSLLFGQNNVLQEEGAVPSRGCAFFFAQLRGMRNPVNGQFQSSISYSRQGASTNNQNQYENMDHR
jgi:hypothetical protein